MTSIIKTGGVIRARINGRLTALTKERIAHEQVRVLAQKLMPYEADAIREGSRAHR